MHTIVILGTNRDNSNTHAKLNEHFVMKNFELIELHKLKIEHYTYDHNQKPNDDFLIVAAKMASADHIIFATPVYWYAMSGVMKVLFDRLTDLITTSKPLGRTFAGKTTELFSTGSDETLPEGFEVPFKRTSEYFEMKYQGATYMCTKV